MAKKQTTEPNFVAFEKFLNKNSNNQTHENENENENQIGTTSINSLIFVDYYQDFNNDRK